MEDKKFILIVDDEIIGAMSLAEHIRFWGYYNCEIAGSVEEAISEVERCRPNLAIMDIKLGENTRGGIEAAKKILAKYRIPIIFITGYDIEELRMESPGELTLFMSKPLDLDLLKGAIKTLLEKNKPGGSASDLPRPRIPDGD